MKRLIAVVLLVLVGLAVLLRTELVAVQSRDVALPADDASPEDVVRVFLEAIDAHDCGTAEDVVTPEFRDAADRWCDRVSSLTIDRVRLSGPGGWASGPDSPGLAVDFTFQSRPFRETVELPDGFTTWGFSVHRDAPGDPWRIDGEGVG